MNRPALRLARPGQQPAPTTGAGSLQVLTEAIDTLTPQHAASWLGELPGTTAATAARRYRNKP
jgi:hypothetical protein